MIIIGFNNSTTSRFPNLMRPFQIQGHILNFMTYTSHGNRSNFYYYWYMEYSRFFCLFLECSYFSLTSLLFLFHLRSPLSALHSTLAYKSRPIRCQTQLTQVGWRVGLPYGKIMAMGRGGRPQVAATRRSDLDVARRHEGLAHNSVGNRTARPHQLGRNS